MYIPKPFLVANEEQLIAFVQEHSFGILFSQSEGEPFATHLPFLIEKDASGDLYLLGHMARSNPHWSKIEGNVLVVFNGPHAYISPTWYQEEKTVPTWNYISVHTYGEFNLINSSKELLNIMNQTINKYESQMPTPWETDLLSEFNSQLMKAIVGFKIKITKIEGKWKLNQNHSTDRRRKLIDGLRQTNDYFSLKVAGLMEDTLDDLR
ncbi:transcriptional regulator [Paenibacillus turicensis]|uniref:Transcriptional regulator n=1 Tax=Paenibacillus turicensis TaxID=160487 RepID=A0ABS4FUS7_9BACL|nr:FMN-binding negative transcriptional regulator [Paenibacillus turicensis]MBP1906333.1 transcriptional regulator [Paenibacillus turicensis]